MTWHDCIQISELQQNFESTKQHFFHFCLKDVFQCVYLPCKILDLIAQYFANFSYAIQICRIWQILVFEWLNLRNFTDSLVNAKACQRIVDNCLRNNEFLIHLKDKHQLKYYLGHILLKHFTSYNQFRQTKQKNMNICKTNKRTRLKSVVLYYLMYLLLCGMHIIHMKHIWNFELYLGKRILIFACCSRKTSVNCN